MLSGQVSPDEQALITVDVHSGIDRRESVDAVIDTGFTGHLTLPADTIGRLGLSPAGRNEFELANGELFEFPVYDGSVIWHGHTLDVHVMESECAPLLGMTLLWGSRITMDAAPHGKVTIERLVPGPG